MQSAHFVEVGYLGGGHGFQPLGFPRRQAAFLMCGDCVDMISAGSTLKLTGAKTSVPRVLNDLARSIGSQNCEGVIMNSGA